MTELASLVLFANDVEETVRFYRAVGVPLEDEDHGEGPVHSAADLAGVHFAVYPASTAGTAPPRRTGGSTFPRLYVRSLDASRHAVEALGATVLSEHEQMPWGCRFVVRDPDHRAVEVNDRAHCPPPPQM